MRCRRCAPHSADRCDGYYHLKALSGLISSGSPPVKLTMWEKRLIGLLPKRPPDARLARILEADRREREQYEATVRGIRWVVELGGETYELSV